MSFDRNKGAYEMSSCEQNTENTGRKGGWWGFEVGIKLAGWGHANKRGPQGSRAGNGAENAGNARRLL